MERIDKKALNLEMLRIAGFTFTGGIWTYPDGVDVDNGVPFFPGSLDACFKWLVPKLKVDEDTIMFAHPIESTKYYCEIIDADGEPVAGSLGYKEPALAFCLAFKELIK